MEYSREYIHYIAKIIESVGVLIIAGGSLYILAGSVIRAAKSKEISYRNIRHELGKVILLGLEILVAADIVATVSTEPTMNSLLTLAVVVLIRTFLSFSLQLELEGKFPWQKKDEVK
jgi:uncharacterized membrane protein